MSRKLISPRNVRWNTRPSYWVEIPPEAQVDDVTIEQAQTDVFKRIEREMEKVISAQRKRMGKGCTRDNGRRCAYCVANNK